MTIHITCRLRDMDGFALNMNQITPGESISEDAGSTPGTRSGLHSKWGLPMELPGIDWGLRQHNPVRRLLNTLERISLSLERPIVHWVRSPEFNPLYHTGTITVFLLIVILVTGLYLTMFYQFGFDASYQAVANIDAILVGRVMRALHRYASASALIASLLHGWRTFFMDRFRGPRWLAWVSGVVMSAFIWVIGVTGYWMIMDERAQVISQTIINFLKSHSWGIDLLLKYLVTDSAGTGWLFILFVTTLHLGVSALVGLFFWYHIQRLRRPKLFPPSCWLWGISALLLFAALLVPLGMLPRADATQLPRQVNIDLFFLFYLPAALHWPVGYFWGGVIAVIVLVTALPWLLLRKPLPPIVVNSQRCTGCTLCAIDCPYKALSMVDRTDGIKHKYVAQVDPKLCVACGVCIGACQPLALSLGNHPAQHTLEQLINHRSEKLGRPVMVIFTCERHAYQGARDYIDNLSETHKDHDEVVIPLTCIGMAHPNLAVRALEAGAREVEFVGCSPEDCANREGNLWLQQRLERKRLPKLQIKYSQAPIKTQWLPPDRFTEALDLKTPSSHPTGYDFVLSKSNFRRFLPALALMGIVLAVQVWLSDIPYQPYPLDTAILEIALDHQSGYPLKDISSPLAAVSGVDSPPHLVLESDGEIILDESYPTIGEGLEVRSPILEQIHISTGVHHLRLVLYDRPGQADPQILLDESIDLKPGQVITLDYEDAHQGGDPVAGERLFNESSLGTNAACRICHTLEPDVVVVGPSLTGVASKAMQRVPGMNAEQYLRQSILEPDAYVVEGFQAGQMLSNLGEILSDEQVEDLVAFLLTLK